MNNPTEKTVAHVGYQYEADAAVAALSDVGIAAYVHQTPETKLFTIPGALGMPEMGFDVVVKLSDAERAEELLRSIGYGADAVSEVEEAADVTGSSENTEASEENKAFENEEEIVFEKSEEAETENTDEEPSLFQKIMAAVLLLLVVAVVVWLADAGVSFIKGLLS